MSSAGRARNAARWQGRGRTWSTPPALFARLDQEFRFTLDAAASHENAKCARYFTEADDGLSQSWLAERVFLNPPYGREIGPWVEKAWRESQGALVVALLPVSSDLPWWHDYVLRADELRFIRGRVRFIADDDRRGWRHAFFASVVVVFRGGGGPPTVCGIPAS